MPIQSLYSIGTSGKYPDLNDEFDEFEGIEICNKYIPKNTRTPGEPGSKKIKSTKKYESKLVENQFRFHQDTSMLYKNLHRIQPDSLISITYKMHGTSGISSYILCKKKLKWYEKLLKSLGVDVIDTQYDYIYSSRKVIKNEELNPNANHFYSEDIWGMAHKELEQYLQKGMTLYYEIVGYLPSGGMIQKDYDYGYNDPMKHGSTKNFLGFNYGIYIYRITQTNIDGKVYEFSARQVQDWCKKNSLNAVPELYYGLAEDFIEPFVELYFADNSLGANKMLAKPKYDPFDVNIFLQEVKKKYNEKDCYICKNIVPEEGCVIRIEGTDLEVYKQKSTRFLEKETKENDKGTINIEDNN